MTQRKLSAGIIKSVVEYNRYCKDRWCNRLSEIPLRPTWAEVDLSAIAHNVREFAGIVPSKTQLMAVVKADGYGHGAVQTARAAISAGASFLGVALVEEALELRQNGITEPILILGFTPREYAAALCEHNLTPTVFTLPEAEAFSDVAVRYGKRLDVHVKVDTGMSRVGCFPCEAADGFIRQIASLPGLTMTGLFTHFATADQRDQEYARNQLTQFLSLVQRLESQGITVPIKHAANSAAAIGFPDSHLDMVRLGISLYGFYSSDEVSRERVNLRPVMTLKSQIVFLKEVPAGTAVSYGCTYTTPEHSLLATIPVGYADGYARRLSNRGQVLVRGVRAPVVGRVCMDQIVINVQDVPGVTEGDEVVLFGRQGDTFIHADELARWLDTINYEIVTSVSHRVPRIYV